MMIISKEEFKTRNKSGKMMLGGLAKIKALEEQLQDVPASQKNKLALINRISALKLIRSDKILAQQATNTRKRRKSKYGERYYVKPVFEQEVNYNTGKKDEDGEYIIEAKLYPKTGTTIFADIIKIYTEKRKEAYLQKLINKGISDTKFAAIKKRIVVGNAGIQVRLNELRTQYVSLTTRIIDFKAYLKKVYRPLERTIMKSGNIGRAVTR